MRRTMDPVNRRSTRIALALAASTMVLSVAGAVTLAKLDPIRTVEARPATEHPPCVYEIYRTTADYFVMLGQVDAVANDQMFISKRTGLVVGFMDPTRDGFVCMLTTDRLVAI